MLQSATQKKKYLSLTAIFKNEADYIVEWLEYYILMGVEHFYLYDNGSDDASQKLLQPYIDKNIVTLHVVPGFKMQMRAYWDALERYTGDTEWMIFCDLDEFLLPKKHHSLLSLVRSYHNYDQLLFRWRNFGDSGHISTPAGLTIENFLYRDADNVHLKPILKLDSVLYFFNMHIAMTEGISYTLPYEEAQCNHYVVRSYEEFLTRKAMRNRENPGTTCRGNVGYEINFFHHHNTNTVFDDGILKYLPSLKRVLGKM